MFTCLIVLGNIFSFSFIWKIFSDIWNHLFLEHLIELCCNVSILWEDSNKLTYIVFASFWICTNNVWKNRIYCQSFIWGGGSCQIIDEKQYYGLVLNLYSLYYDKFTECFNFKDCFLFLKVVLFFFQICLVGIVSCFGSLF